MRPIDILKDKWNMKYNACILLITWDSMITLMAVDLIGFVNARVTQSSFSRQYIIDRFSSTLPKDMKKICSLL